MTMHSRRAPQHTLPRLALAGMACLLAACAPVPTQPPASALVDAKAKEAPYASRVPSGDPE